MGWFDNEKDDKPQAPPSPSASPARPTAVAPAARAGDGSTLGERVHVNGTIVCEESLSILGKVEGTIHARQDLTIVKGADVRAVIHGRKVNVQGTVTGDVHATEVVVLGPSASLTGNIRTPSLQIQEGAFFKGSVEMSSAEPAKKADKPVAERPAAVKPAPSRATGTAKDGGAAAAAVTGPKSDAGGRAAGS